ncbi:MAG: peptidase E [Anaerolineaceae bacterium]|nr:peptidase E [Anaerolineaceae bacterium]
MKQIIALGGGGFSMEPDNLALDRYIIAQTGKSDPKVCFIPTASAESPDYIVNFYAAFNKLGCHPTHLSLFRLPQADLEAFILEQDIIYVGGGNTRSMLALWRAWNLDEILRKAWGAGVLLAGISAGAICWFEQGVTDSVPGELGALDCLGFLGGSCCPHYDGEENRRPEFQRLLSEGLIRPGYALDDGVGLHYCTEKLEKIISSRPAARAYRLEVVAGEVVEQTLEPNFLGES